MDMSKLTALPLVNVGAASIKVARLNQRSMTFLGLAIRLNDTFRMGAVQTAYPEDVITMSSATYSALVSEDNKGRLTPLADLLEQSVQDSRAGMKATMLDLSVKSPTKVVDRRRVTRYSDDRVDYVGRGISDLVSQMTTLLQTPGRSEGSTSAVAKRYAELAGEMRLLREALTAAEGKFEVAQSLVIRLMGDDE